LGIFPFQNGKTDGGFDAPKTAVSKPPKRGGFETTQSHKNATFARKYHKKENRRWGKAVLKWSV
jgi:hypothetical protein